MFGFRFIKFQPGEYAMLVRNGRIVREGIGLSLTFFERSASLVMVPVASTEVPFIFVEVTADFQEVTLQGQLTWRIADPKKIASLLNFTLDKRGERYLSDDNEKYPQRIVNAIQVITKKAVQKASLRTLLTSTESLVETILGGIRKHPEVEALGLEILGLAILAIRPNADTARALEARAREEILKEADDAIYARRNASVEQERIIKENELSTEIAIENKKREIREAQMEAERVIQQKQHALKETEMAFSVAQEERKEELVKLAARNARIEAEAGSYAIETALKAFKDADPTVIQALVTGGMQPQQIIAQAFQGIAARADRIGQLNISPELLQELLRKGSDAKPAD